MRLSLRTRERRRFGHEDEMAGRKVGNRRFLIIEGYDGANLIFKGGPVPLGNLTDEGIIRLLQRLACKGLDEEEIIAASLPKNAKGYHPLLDPQFDRGGHRRWVTVGHGIKYTASIWSEDELPQDRD